MATPESGHQLGTVSDSITVALAGPPNVGKSTIFNALTGLRQRVGNWPGKTVERKEGVVEFGGRTIHLVDLPGTYALTAHSVEEEIAREFLLGERPRVIIAVVNAAALERGLYLVSELLLLGIPVVVALNMTDVAEAIGVDIEPDVLQAAMSVPVVPVCGTGRLGLDRLLQRVVEVADGCVQSAPRLPQVRPDHRQVYDQIIQLIRKHLRAEYPAEWVTMKLFEADPRVTELLQQQLPPETVESIRAILQRHDDAFWAVVSGRYEWVGRMVRAAVKRPRTRVIGWTERADEWLTHPVWGMLALGLILGVVFLLTAWVGKPLQELLDESLVTRTASALRAAFGDSVPWWGQLLVEGVIPGVGTVASFLPIMLIFFTALAVLEDAGYMARAAFVMDRFMHVLGLHGRSFLPLMLGFGCNVPAVLGARVLEAGRAQLLTILLAPFVPCTARLAVITVLAPIFFGFWAPLVAFGLVAIALVCLAIAGWLLNRFMPGQRSVLIMELPLYHKPDLSTVARAVYDQVLAFLRKAATVIVVMSVVVWYASTYPGGDPGTSYLARLGHALAPAAKLIGFDSRLAVAVMSSVIAKENAISTLAILLGGDQRTFADGIRAIYSPASGLSFLVVMTLFVPCLPTMVTMWKETGSINWVLLSAAIMVTMSFAAGLSAFHLANIFFR